MDRIRRTEEKFRELFHGAPSGNEGNDPEFMQILQRFIFGEVSYAGSLDTRMRELITVTVLAAEQTLPQLKAHVGASLNVGLSPLEIREAIYQCAPFIGFPKTLNAISAMNEEFVSRGISLPLESAVTVTEDTRYENGLAVQAPLYGTEIADRYEWLPGGFSEEVPKWLTELCFSDFSTRKGLGEKTRELLEVVVLAALGGAETQVRSHVKGALAAGNTAEEIVCALCHAMPYMGVPRLFNALNCSSDILDKDRDTNEENFEKMNVFGRGAENTAYADYFTGNSYLKPLTSQNCKLTFANVTFEPGCRNHWHIHHAEKGGGQILLCVAGGGWYQEYGKPARSLAPGDVVEIPANVKHWHGAKKNEWFSHIAVEIPGKNTSNEWLEEVSDDEYDKLDG